MFLSCLGPARAESLPCAAARRFTFPVQRPYGALAPTPGGLGSLGSPDAYAPSRQLEPRRHRRRARLQQLRRPDRRGGFARGGRRRARRGRHVLRHRGHLRQRGGSEEIIGRALAGRRDQVVLATKFGNDMGDGETAPRRAPLHPQGGRGVAAAAADRLDRPLPVPPPRRRHAARGDARRARRARPRGHGARDRLLELHRADGRGGARCRRRARLRRRSSPRRTSTRGSSGRPRTSCSRPASGSASASSRTSRSRAGC